MNNFKVLLVLVSFYNNHFAFGDQFDYTTTKTYDLDIPGSDPIRIIEGEPLWTPNPLKKSLQSNFEHRSFTTDTTKTNLNQPIVEDEQEFSNVALKEFLDNYAAKLQKEKPLSSSVGSIEDEIGGNPEEKSKSWSLLHVQKHKHPFDDKKGWVSLEPVPWSVSKISKWQSSQVKPQSEQSWGNYQEKPSWDFSANNKPSWEYNRPPSDNYEQNKYESYQGHEYKPTYPKPSAIFDQTVHLEQSQDYSGDFPRPNFGVGKKPTKINQHYKHNENCKHPEDDLGEIITDGLPPNFPSSNSQEFRRRGSEFHPESHPFVGDGDWVLLSTTKGYKYPKTRQRSLDINPESIGAHRAVRLTVLPPLKGSKVNMTTSHGGLLQVESTFETVDQAHKKFVKKQKLKRRQKKKPQRIVHINKPGGVNAYRDATLATVPRQTSGVDGSAVLAAVGAGMIPATMAMLVPMALNGRKRRDTRFVTSNPFSLVEMTLPRNI